MSERPESLSQVVLSCQGCGENGLVARRGAGSEPVLCAVLCTACYVDHGGRRPSQHPAWCVFTGRHALCSGEFDHPRSVCKAVLWSAVEADGTPDAAAGWALAGMLAATREDWRPVRGAVGRGTAAVAAFGRARDRAWSAGVVASCGDVVEVLAGGLYLAGAEGWAPQEVVGALGRLRDPRVACGLKAVARGVGDVLALGQSRGVEHGVLLARALVSHAQQIGE